MKPTVRLNVGRLFLSSLVMLAVNLGAGAAAEKDREAVARGRELFTREWLPGDRRSHAGDGLGPLFNARSCAACHHLGGIGGAGPKHTNVTIVSAFLEPRNGGIFASIFGIRPKRPQQPDRSKLAEIHPGLRTENSFPLHRFATEKEFANWRGKLVSDGLGFISFGSDL